METYSVLSRPNVWIAGGGWGSGGNSDKLLKIFQFLVRISKVDNLQAVSLVCKLKSWIFRWKPKSHGKHANLPYVRACCRHAWNCAKKLSTNISVRYKSSSISFSNLQTLTRHPYTVSARPSTWMQSQRKTAWRRFRLSSLIPAKRLVKVYLITKCWLMGVNLFSGVIKDDFQQLEHLNERLERNSPQMAGSKSSESQEVGSFIRVSRARQELERSLQFVVCPWRQEEKSREEVDWREVSGLQCWDEVGLEKAGSAWLLSDQIVSFAWFCFCHLRLKISLFVARKFPLSWEIRET